MCDFMYRVYTFIDTFMHCALYVFYKANKDHYYYYYKINLHGTLLPWFHFQIVLF